MRSRFGEGRKRAPKLTAREAPRNYRTRCTTESRGIAAFANNFPGDSLCATFEQINDGFATIVQDFALSERQALFHDNAVRVYDIHTL